MTRRLRPLTFTASDQLPMSCSACAFWESAGERERRCGTVCDADLQGAWYRRVTDEWGECGRVAFDNGEVLGFVKYAPSGFFPQAATFAAAPEDPSVPLIACLHISQDARHRGLGTVLLRAALRDLVGRGERRVEAFGHTRGKSDREEMPMLGKAFLLRNGFTVTRADPVYPLLRLDLKSLALWQDNLEAVLESLISDARARSRSGVVDEGIVTAMADGPRKSGSADRVRAYLTEHSLDDRIIEFETPTKTAQQAADAAGCELGQIVKSLVFVVDDRPVLVLVAGDRRGDAEVIAALMGGTEAHFADAETVRVATGYAIGGVSPFALPDGLPVLVDDSLGRFETVYPAAGTPDSMVKMRRADLLDLSGGRVARVSL